MKKIRTNPKSVQAALTTVDTTDNDADSESDHWECSCGIVHGRYDVCPRCNESAFDYRNE
jgi:hypothetical protein